MTSSCATHVTVLLALACAPQFDDLDSALVVSVADMEQSNMNSLEAAERDSELAVLQVRSWKDAKEYQYQCRYY